MDNNLNLSFKIMQVKHLGCDEGMFFHLLQER